MPAIDRVKAHWSELITQRREITVPEWGDAGGPLVIHVRPTNMAQRSKLMKLGQANDLAFCAETLILRARDADGAPLFTPKDADTLMTSCDPDVLVRVAGEINEDLQDLANDDEGGSLAKK